MDNNFVKLIGYDAEGNARVLFDIENVKTVEEKSPMPELETGMFIILDLTEEREEKYYGFVYNDKIIWQKVGWDEAKDIHADKRHEDDMKAKLTIYKKDKLYCFPNDNFKDYIFWVGEVWYG